MTLPRTSNASFPFALMGMRCCNGQQARFTMRRRAMRRAATRARFGIILVLAATAISLRAGRATIYQWEYIDQGNRI
jgi:hypothetical protein